MMPPEGPNKSEELLQRYAKQRREQGQDFSLHPATRRLLQGEVARHFPASAKESRSGLMTWLGLWRGRFALGGAIAAILITGFWIISSSRQEKPMQLAGVKAPPQDEFFAKAQPERAPQPDDAKQVLLANTVTPATRKLPEQPVMLRAARQSGSERLARAEFESGARLASDPATPAQKASMPSDSLAHVAPQFGFDFFSITTNDVNGYANGYALSLKPAANNRGGIAREAETPGVQSNLYAFGLNGSIDARSLEARLGEVRGFSFGRSVTNTAAFADGIWLSYAEPAVPALLAAKDSQTETRLGSEMMKEQELRRFANTRGLNETEKRESLRGDTAGTVPAGVASKPVAAGLDTAERVSEEKLSKNVLAEMPAESAGLPSASADGATMRFYRLSTAAAQDKTARDQAFNKAKVDLNGTRVLARFAVEQRGRNVRLVDADGSLYEGNVEDPLAAELDPKFKAVDRPDSKSLKRENIPGLNEPDLSSAQEYSFRAVGSNVTLREPVVITGKFVRTTATTGTPGDSGAVSRGPAPAPLRTRTVAPQTQPSAATPRGAFGGGLSPSTNSALAIEGTVRIGATNLQWFRAVREQR
jgi:hypothetical protein